MEPSFSGRFVCRLRKRSGGMITPSNQVDGGRWRRRRRRRRHEQEFMRVCGALKGARRKRKAAYARASGAPGDQAARSEGLCMRMSLEAAGFSLEMTACLAPAGTNQSRAIFEFRPKGPNVESVSEHSTTTPSPTTKFKFSKRTGACW